MATAATSASTSTSADTASAGTSSTASTAPNANNIKVGSRSIICQDAEIRGEVTIGSGCILHPRCTIFAYAGPIVIGDCCIIEETAVILNRSKEPMMIGSYNHFETGARIESPRIGSYNTFEPRSRVPQSVTLGDYCVIGAGCSVVPVVGASQADFDRLDALLDAEEGGADQQASVSSQPYLDVAAQKEHLEDYTVVYGADNDRRTWSGEGKGQQVALMHKHLAYLTEMLPKYSRLKLITQ